MMSWIRPILRILCLLFIISVIAVLHEAEARGGRGGGRSGGFRSSSSYRSSYRSSSYRSSYRSSSRLSRSFRSSTLRRGTSPYTRSNWKYYAGIGMIYGSTRYMRTRRYYDHPDEMPTVCDNRYDRSPNGTVWGYFICPKDGESDDLDYCCGPDGQEYCCAFGDDPGRVAGIVIGSLVAVGIVGCMVYCCCCRKTSSGGTIIQRMSTRKSNTSSYPHVYSSVKQDIVTNGDAAAAPPPPGAMAGAGYDATKGGLPYTPNPGYPPPPDGGYYPPPGMPGYALPPDGKEPLPQGTVSDTGPGGFAAPYPPPDPNAGPGGFGAPYPPPDPSAPQGPAPPGFMYPPPPNGPPAPSGNPYPSQPPPPYMQ